MHTLKHLLQHRDVEMHVSSIGTYESRFLSGQHLGSISDAISHTFLSGGNATNQWDTASASRMLLSILCFSAVP